MPSARAMPCKNAPRLLPHGRDGHTSRAAASVGCVGLFTPQANRAPRAQQQQSVDDRERVGGRRVCEDEE